MLSLRYRDSGFPVRTSVVLGTEVPLPEGKVHELFRPAGTSDL